MNAPTSLSSGSGPAKWVAVFVLGIASGGGLVYSIVTRSPAPLAPAPAAAPQQPQPIIVQMAPPAAAPAQPSAPAAAPDQVAAPPTPPASTPPAQPAAGVPAPEQSPHTTIPQAPATDAPPPRTPLTPAPAVNPAAPVTPAPPSAVHKININTAGQSELELLPQVGPALAKRIIEHREKHGPFRNTRELDNVKGIGAKTLEKLLPLVTIEPEKKPR